MKVLLAILVSFVLLTSVAAAEIMSVPYYLGQGGFRLLVTGMQDTNWGNQSGQNLTTVGGDFVLGILDGLDASMQFGFGTAGGLPAGSTGSSNSLGGILKYTVLQGDIYDEASFSIAVLGGAKTIDTEMRTGGTTLTTNDTQVLFGAIYGIYAPFIDPYLGTVYRVTSGDNEGVAFDFTIGGTFPLMMGTGMFLEYTLRSITPSGAANYTSDQIAFGIGIAAVGDY